MTSACECVWNKKQQIRNDLHRVFLMIFHFYFWNLFEVHRAECIYMRFEKKTQINEKQLIWNKKIPFSLFQYIAI